MKNKLLMVLCISLVIGLAFTLSVSAGGQKEGGGQGAMAAKPLPVVGISTGSSGTQWRDEMIDSLKMVGDEFKAAGKIKDYKIVNNVTNGDATEQANIIRNFISQGVNIIMLNPNSPDALNGVIKEAQNAGIVVVSFDATVTAPGMLKVTLDHYAWAQKWASYLCKQMQSGNVIDIYGLPGHPANNDRLKAEADVVAKYPNIHEIASASGYWDETKAKEAAAQIIASGKQIDCVFTQDGMAYGVLQAFLDAGKLPKYMYADPSTISFKEWKSLLDQGKDIDWVTENNPPGIGGTAFRMILDAYNGKQFKPDVLKNEVYYYSNTVMITKANFDQGWAMLKDKPDTYLLNNVMSQQDVDALFQ